MLYSIFINNTRVKYSDFYKYLLNYYSSQWNIIEEFKGAVSLINIENENAREYALSKTKNKFNSFSAEYNNCIIEYFEKYEPEFFNKLLTEFIDTSIPDLISNEYIVVNTPKMAIMLLDNYDMITFKRNNKIG